MNLASTVVRPRQNISLTPRRASLIMRGVINNTYQFSVMMNFLIANIRRTESDLPRQAGWVSASRYPFAVWFSFWFGFYFSSDRGVGSPV